MDLQDGQDKSLKKKRKGRIEEESRAGFLPPRE